MKQDYTYISDPVGISHPNHLAAIGTLLGLQVPDVRSARILEIACGTGGNIISIAYTLPDSQCAGFDISADAVGRANSIIRECALKNIEVRDQNILDVSAASGTFDYIICHGTYSWVTEDVRSKLLEIYRHNLAPNGIGYISFAVLPGMRARDELRAFLLPKINHLPEMSARVTRAREIVTEELQKIANEPVSPRMMELRMAAVAPDWLLSHDLLAPIANNIHFDKFASALRTHELAYFGDADVTRMMQLDLPAVERERLHGFGGDFVRVECEKDLLRNTSFRRSIVGHIEARPNLQLSSERIGELHIASSLVPVAGDPSRFTALSGAELVTRNSDLVAALEILRGVWPATIEVNTLGDRIGLADERKAKLREQLLVCFQLNAASLFQIPMRVVSVVGQRPRASALARIMAREGRLVPNLYSHLIALEPGDPELLMQLDGARSVADLKLADNLKKTEAIGNRLVRFAKLALLES